MSPHSTPKSSLSLQRDALIYRQRSSALIITLVMLCLIAILLLGFATRVSLDLGSSSSHFNRVQAELYARMGLDAAQTELANTLTVSGAYWNTRPGEIMEITNFSTGATVFNSLSSGTPSSGFGSNDAVDINSASFSGNGMGLLTSTNFSIPVSWVYVKQDGTYAVALPTYNAANPVIGRFAYWVDDESAKINLNTAWTRAATNSLNSNLSDPSRVELANLLSLTQNDANNLNAARSASPDQYFNSLEDIHRAGVADVDEVLTNYPFSFSAYNHSPADWAGVSMLGQPRLILTTQAAYAGGSTNYLNILLTNNSDPGTLASLNGANVTATVNQIYRYLTNTSWPIAPGKSFAAKFSPSNPSRLIQLALDIVEYVRCAESTNVCVEPIRGDLSGNSFVYNATAGSTNSFWGNVRGPRLTEMGCYFNPPYTAPFPGASTNKLTFVFEVYLPPYYGISSIPLTNLNVGVNYFASSTTAILNSSTNTSTIPTTGILNSGQYAVVQFSGPLVISAPSPTATAPARINMRADIQNAQKAGINFDTCPILNLGGSGGLSNNIIYTLDNPPQNSSATITSVAVDDPSLNKCARYWLQGTANTFGAVNANFSTLGHVPGNYSPQQDTDAYGYITNGGMAFPAPKGTGSNPYGVVRSLGELGYIHTGIETCSTNTGTPWRTLRLQPQNAGVSTLPDWAMLDLFALPIVPPNTNYFVQPNFAVSGTSTNVFSLGGKVNLNGYLFTNSQGNPLVGDPNPEQAVFMGASNSFSTVLSTSQAALIATNIINHVLANANLNGTMNTGISWGSGEATKYYFSPGQLAEIQGVSDGGEASEAVLRDILGLATVRSNVFSIYTVGQALKQDASGNLHVLSEQRFQNVVERWNTLSGSTPQTFFRPVYIRTLNP